MVFGPLLDKFHLHPCPSPFSFSSSLRLWTLKLTFASCFGKALILIVTIVIIDENGLLVKGLLFLNYYNYSYVYSYDSDNTDDDTNLPCVRSTAGTCGGSSLTTLGTNPSNSLHTVFTCICACEGCICPCVGSYLQEILHWARKDKNMTKKENREEKLKIYKKNLDKK